MGGCFHNQMEQKHCLLHVLSFQFDQQVSSQDQTRQNKMRASSTTKLAKPTMVWYDVEHAATRHIPTPSHYHHKYFDLTLGLQYDSPEFQTLKTPFSRAMWHRLHQEHLPVKTTHRILDGFGLCSAYSVKTKRWYLFCHPRHIDPLYPTEQDILEHLAEETYIDAGVSRTTLTWILPHSYNDFLHSNIVNKMCCKQNYKEIQQDREPRLQEFVWDPEMVLDYYRKSPYDLALSPLQLAQKTLILILLCTGKHPGNIMKMSLDSYQKFIEINSFSY